MATTSAPKFVPSFNAQPLCRIVGLACLAGFLTNMVLLALPATVSNPEWRIFFLQSTSDRSIVLLFGAALTIYGNFENRHWRKRLSMGCMMLGIACLLSCVLAIGDGLQLSKAAESNIAQQASEAQTQIQTAKNDPKTAPNITPEQLKQASELVDTRATSMKQTAKNNIMKTVVVVVSNLVVIAIALISLGYYGMRPQRG